MKKSQLLKIAGALTLISAVLNTIYSVLRYKEDIPTSQPDIIILIILAVIEIISVVLLGIGFLIANKQLIISYWGICAASDIGYLIRLAVYYFDCTGKGISMESDYILRNVLCDIFSLLLDVAIVLFLIYVFKTIEKSKSTHLPIKSDIGIKNNNVVEILQYKELLDNGTITQEEFDKKKKELLDL